MRDGTDTWQFSYNADGLRTKRVSDSYAYTYRYDGDQLRTMSVDNVHMFFVYNADGPMAISYSGTTYYYTKNLQGDITGIVDSNGNSVVEYTYDAWGNILSITGSLASTLGAHNPLRYRGYVYDQETQLYYLQSRYYNPETGRFINADAFATTGQGLLGNNMFAYCGNNPIMRQDSSGHSWKSFWENVKNWFVKKKEKAANNNNITATIGATGSAAFGGVSASLGITKDTKGNIGLSLTTNGGGGFPNLGGGAFVSVNNTPTIYEQSGLGTVVGASGGPWVVAIGGEYNMLINQEEDCVYHGATISATVGLYPTVVEVHGEVGYTWVWGINIYDIAISIADFMGGN